MQFTHIIFSASPEDWQTQSQGIARLKIDTAAMPGEIGDDKPRRIYLFNNFIIYLVYVFHAIHPNWIVTRLEYTSLKPS